MKNQYGLDVSYFESKLKIVLRDVANYTPQEMARELHRLSMTADENAVCEEVDKYIKVMNEQ